MRPCSNARSSPLGGSWRPLSVHGEVVDPEVDLFAREGTFIKRVLVGLLDQSPGLEVVLEPITASGVAFVPAGAERLAASIASW